MILVAVITVIPLFGLFSTADSNEFTASGIQFEIFPEYYESEDSFFRAVEGFIKDAVDADAEIDLIVFPEYIGVFYQLIDFNAITFQHDNFQSALLHILEKNPQYSSLADLFLGNSAWKSFLDRWSELSDRYDVTIVAGSCFVPDEINRLRNRTHVFGADGELIYYQDKVFLTEFETDIVGLSPGCLSNTGFFIVNNKKIALTICRDAYLREWEQKHSGAFLWVDIKANGEVFDEAQQRSFMRALPARLLNTDVNNGMTVCAVGEYLDLFWQGESSAFFKNSHGKLTIAEKAGSCDSADIIIFSMPEAQ